MIEFFRKGKYTVCFLQAMAFWGVLCVLFFTPSRVFADREDRFLEEISRRPYGGSGMAPTVTEIFSQPGESALLSRQSVMFMQRALARYETVVRTGGFPIVTSRRLLRLGVQGKEVAVLHKRLALEGYLPVSQRPSERFESDLEHALAHFQKNHGLYVTGQLDDFTKEELNISAEERLFALRVNFLRMLSYEKNLSERYIVVNIPSAQLEAVQAQGVFSRHNAVVGKRDRPSPVLSSFVREIHFNPYWYAPVSIVEKDIIPQARENPLILSQLGIRVYEKGGVEVDPQKIDWKTVHPARYAFRQDPGKNNAMAAIKVSFANPYSVYMHDTPSKNLFTSSERYFSSGCVRVDRVDVLVDWIVSGQAGWNLKKIMALKESGERLDLKVSAPPQVRFVYLTAWAKDLDGIAHFRGDIYQLDHTSFVSGDPVAFLERQKVFVPPSVH